MRVVVVYESLFGNTRQIAEAVGKGVEEAEPGADVECLRVADAGPEHVDGVDLLVVGGPTHMRGMTSRMSRSMGLSGEEKKAGDDFAPDPGADGPGVRDFLHHLPEGRPGARAAAFDTRADMRLAGGAAKSIAHRLGRHGYALAVPPEGFIIEDTEGPLHDGELTRAREWGAALARAASQS